MALQVVLFPFGCSSKVEAIEPNCVEPGNTEYRYYTDDEDVDHFFSDKNCNYEIERGSWVLNTNDDHDRGEWVVIKPATETEEGLEQRVCKNDDTHVETRAIPKLEPTTNSDPLDNSSTGPTTGSDSNPATGAGAAAATALVLGAGIVMVSRKRR